MSNERDVAGPAVGADLRVHLFNDWFVPTLRSFAAWAISIGWTLASELIERATDAMGRSSISPQR
jgi:hypothetical protein